MDYETLRNHLLKIAALAEEAGKESAKGNQDKAIKYRLEVADIIFKNVMSWYEEIFGSL